MEIIVICRQIGCYRFENPFSAIIPRKSGEDMAYAFGTIGVFPTNGFLAHASVSPLRK